EVCRRIRENEATALVPIVMVTSHESEARIDGIRAGADDFVTKPFDQQELLLRVRSLVRVKRYHDTIRAQAAELAEWNRTLEGRGREEGMGVVGSSHSGMGELILKCEATVGWFAGDGLMVWFNDPIPCDEPAARAVRLALEMRDAMGELTARWRKRGHELDFS